MIPLEKNGFMSPASFDEHIDGLSRRGPSINVVAQKYMQRSYWRGAREMEIDCRKDACEQVRASVYIAHGIDAKPDR